MKKKSVRGDTVPKTHMRKKTTKAMTAKETAVKKNGQKKNQSR